MSFTLKYLLNNYLELSWGLFLKQSRLDIETLLTQQLEIHCDLCLVESFLEYKNEKTFLKFKSSDIIILSKSRLFMQYNYNCWLHKPISSTVIESWVSTQRGGSGRLR